MRLSYPGEMERADLEAFLNRDWGAIQALKERFWVERKRQLTPDEALRIGDALRQQARALRPDWPSDEERQEDLAHHVRVSALLRSVRRPLDD